MEISGGVNRRRQSLSDEKIDSPNLRAKEDEDRRNALAGLTLSAVLSTGNRRSPAQVHRTLLDIIRDDPNGGFKDNKKSWKSFRDKLRLRRAGAAWTSTVHIPASDVPIRNTNNNRMISRRNSTRFPTTSVSNPDDSTQPELAESNSGQSSNRAMMLRRNSSRIPSLANSREGRLDYAIRRDGSLNSADDVVAGDATELHRRVQSPEDEEEEEGETEGEAAVEGGGEPAVRMSLMALLAETDREMGLDGSAYIMGGGGGGVVDDDDEEEDEESEGVEGYNNCCVCMVRHKGAAFIPCGHTFCRLCSRELWVQRGNCPLCNGFILEILDIF